MNAANGARADALRRTLEFVGAAEARGGLLRRGYAYAGPTDFVLREGTAYEPRPLPARYRLGAPRACFGNALVACGLWPELRYVEGYASSILFPDLPILHAWNLDAFDAVVDVTWAGDDRPLGVAYLGVEFGPCRAIDAVWNGDGCVLDDRHRDWPVLREPWPGAALDEQAALARVT